MKNKFGINKVKNNSLQTTIKAKDDQSTQLAMSTVESGQRAQAPSVAILDQVPAQSALKKTVVLQNYQGSNLTRKSISNEITEPDKIDDTKSKVIKPKSDPVVAERDKFGATKALRDAIDQKYEMT